MVQAARLGEVCAVYAPLYRQGDDRNLLLQVKKNASSSSRPRFSDVYDAFLHYMGQHNQEGKWFSVGHSQGADMISRLAARRVRSRSDMQTRLLVALPIGGPVEVPQGKLTGGSFANIPLCSRPDETGCVVAFEPTAPAAIPAKRSSHRPDMRACVRTSRWNLEFTRADFRARTTRRC